MPHSPKPFYKPKRRSWYVEIDRVQHLLGRHPDDQPPPQKRGRHWDPPPGILAEFYKRMAELQARPKPPSQRKELPSDSVLSVIEQYRGWCHEGSSQPARTGADTSRPSRPHSAVCSVSCRTQK
jgi:hypothetical protein